MITSKERRLLRSKLEKYEGRINHLYLDSKGYVTIGVGHLLNSAAQAQKLTFRTAINLPATAAEIKADYDAVKKQPSNRVASFYRKQTKLTLPDTSIDKLTDKHIDSFELELKLIYPGFHKFPSAVKLALFDLIFNLGMSNLKNKWPKFNAAVKATDWQKAAEHSRRSPPVSAERNEYVEKLLKSAAVSKSDATATK